MLAREIQPLKIAIDKHWHEKMSANERQLHSSEYVILFWKQKMHLEKCLSNCLKCTALTLKIRVFFPQRAVASSRPLIWLCQDLIGMLVAPRSDIVVFLLNGNHTVIAVHTICRGRAVTGNKESIVWKVGMWKCNCYFSTVLVRWTYGYIITCVSKLVL